MVRAQRALRTTIKQMHFSNKTIYFDSTSVRPSVSPRSVSPSDYGAAIKMTVNWGGPNGKRADITWISVYACKSGRVGGGGGEMTNRRDIVRGVGLNRE